MVSLTPARILGFDVEIGSPEVGKSTDFVVLGPDRDVQQVHVGDERVV